MASMNATASIGITGTRAIRCGAGVEQASVSNVRFGNTGRFKFHVLPEGGVAFKRAGSLVVRAEGKTDAPTSPMSTPPGSDEFPLGVISSTAPLEQGTDKPVGERIAYVCQDCGYVYDQETPFEDVSDEYNCPQCAAPKMRFVMANASVEEMLDTTEEDDAVSRGSGVKSGSPPTQN